MSSRPSRGAARLAAILDALPDALVLVNTNGTVVNANSIALEAFEAPGTALVGRGLLDLLPEFDSRLIPGSMRRPDTVTDERGRTKPTRMMARRTDGSEFPVEVTSANLADGARDAVDPYGTGGLGGGGYSGSELLMLVVRDLSGTLDTEAELARSQRQTEMILRAAAEGVVGTDTDGRIVLVNPAAAQILGFRASDLGGKELHTLVLHSRADGDPFPYEESPLADTLRSGRKHRVRGQVLWAKSGEKVPVDMTTAPVRDGDQLVGAVMTFTDRRPFDQLVTEHAQELARRDEEAEKEREERAAELERVREELTSELASVREDLTGELAAAREQHAEELSAERERGAAFAEREKDRFEALAARHAQLLAVLDQSLRGPLEELRRELGQLAADDAGQLWPEANQVLHHLSAGYSRMTTLVDNVLAYQLLDTDDEKLARVPAMLDAVVAAGVDGAVELIGPGRVQFAVHAPPIEAEVDAGRLATALAHLIADVAGIDATGNSRAVAGGGYVDSTVVVAAAQRGDSVRIEVRGPYSGGDPVHEPIVRGIVRAHGGVLQTHEVPGMSGSAYVLEVPIGGGAGVVPAAPAPTAEPSAVAPEADAAQDVPAQATRGGRRRARRASGPSVDAFLESGLAEPPAAGGGTGRRRGRRAAEEPPVAGAGASSGEQASVGSGVAVRGDVPVEAGGAEGAGRPELPVAQDAPVGPADSGAPSSGTGRRRARRADDDGGAVEHAAAQGAVVTSAEHAAGSPALGEAVPPQGVPAPTGRRARRDGAQEQHALPALPSAAAHETPGAGANALEPAEAGAAAQPSGRRARRALGTAQTAAPASSQQPREAFALPPAEADRTPQPVPQPVQPQPVQPQASVPGQVPFVVPSVPGAASQDEPQAPPAPAPVAAPTVAPMQFEDDGDDAEDTGVAGASDGAGAPGAQPVADEPQQHASAEPDPAQDHTPPQPHPAQPTPARGTPAPQQQPPQQAPQQARAAQPLPAEAPQSPQPPTGDTNSTQGRAFSVRTLGQGVPFGRQIAEQQRRGQTPGPVPGSVPPQAPAQAGATPPQGVPQPADGHSQGGGTTSGSGRRRKLSTRPDQPEAPGAQTPPQGTATATPATAPAPAAAPAPAPNAARPHPQPPRLSPNASEGAGRSYAIGAPDQNAAEGPEPLDGPGGAVEIANRPQPQPMDDELPPEPLDNPRRLLVWPAPDVTTQQALSDRGYRPVTVHSREEVDAQIAAFPAALFVDPLTGPITRTALQSLRQAAVAAEVPVLVTAGLGQATREAAYGADPAVLLKALAPRDSEQHPPRVLLIEEHEEIALALTATLERRGMQVARAASDADAVTLAGQMRPNLVVMDLLQVRRRRAGIIDWLRANGQLNRTPLVVYTAAVDEADLPRLAAGETVLFLAERSTSDEVQGRIVDLLAKIGTN
ncbi:response regulator [Streptomyces xanthii]|uniref:PAS domain-containing protein n=1 Tax=Streptomyces xanthii TaxID=2768069 RepID=A0A7H1B8X2_9ACTN|nr:PAS domain-containing protein [Streptomyces xanthii]QNS05177.1 PAS domain-containing protein [Streptomyces xanthii]